MVLQQVNEAGFAFTKAKLILTQQTLLYPRAHRSYSFFVDSIVLPGIEVRFLG